VNPRNRPDRRVLLALAALAGVMLLWALASGALVWSTFEPAERELVGPLIGGRLALAGVVLLFVLMIAAVGINALYRQYIVAPARLLDDARIVLGTDVVRELTPLGSAENRALTEVVSGFAEQRAALRADIAQQVRDASRSIEQERSRLAALMSELRQSVVVCNLDGRVLLYNNRARLQFRALSDAPSVASGAELIGLGRSIYTVFDRKLVAHALENIQQRMQRGVASPSAQFVTTTRAGQLLRAQMTPSPPVARRRRPHHRRLRADAGQHHARFRGRFGARQGAARPHRRQPRVARQHAGCHRHAGFPRPGAGHARALPGRHPRRGRRTEHAHPHAGRRSDAWTQGTLAAGRHAGRRPGVGRAAPHRNAEGTRAQADEVDSALWLKVDSFSLLQALTYLASRLADEYDIRSVQLRLQPRRRATGARTST
jgi:DNA polymerase-3 subunit epsilon